MGLQVRHGLGLVSCSDLWTLLPIAALNVLFFNILSSLCEFL